MFSERDRHHSSLSEREAQIKLKALNQATVKMATQIEKMEQKNIKLMKKLVIVSAYMYMYLYLYSPLDLPLDLTYVHVHITCTHFLL